MLNRRVMCALIWVPSPRCSRPPDSACRSSAAAAVVIGLRANATAIAVPSSTRSVAVAASASPMNGSCLTSLSQNPSNLPASARWAAARTSTWPSSAAPLSSRTSEQLEDRGVGLTAALAHGLQPVADAVVAHVVHQRRHQPRAGAAERMAERDRAAVGVERLGVGAEVVQPGQRHRGEGLVDLERADLLDREPRLRQRLL